MIQWEYQTIITGPLGSTAVANQSAIGALGLPALGVEEWEIVSAVLVPSLTDGRLIDSSVRSRDGLKTGPLKQDDNRSDPRSRKTNQKLLPRQLRYGLGLRSHGLSQTRAQRS